MKSIRTKLSLITVCAIILSMAAATAIGVYGVRQIGRKSADQTLYLMCETGEKNLNYYFQSIEQSVEMVSTYAESDLQGLDPSELHEHIDRVETVFERVSSQTNGVLTFYYRIDPEYSGEESGFWYVDRDRHGYMELAVTDITSYDTSDTSVIPWFTVPKQTGNPVWLPPYITADNNNARVLSYSAPIYQGDTFVGVIGIEIDYSTMAEQVNNIRLYENGYAFITDAEGDLIYHPYIDVTTVSEEERPACPPELLSNNAMVVYEYDGVMKQAYRLTLSNGMKLNVSVPVSEIDGNWHELTLMTIVASLGLLVLFVFISMSASGKITKPLKELTEAAEQVNQGNYDVELREGSDDEIGVLTHVFKKLVSNLKIYIHDLNELNKHLKEDNVTLEAATIRDSLTGVKNRFALRRDYDKYIEKDIHIMMLDVDDFKQVNDGFGHSVGDYLLKKIGDALVDHFSVDYSYRYGGDEFLIIFPDISEYDFKTAVRDLNEQLEEIYLDDQKLPVHFSAGYVYGKAVLGDDVRLMLRQADELLYSAKGKGKNTYIGAPYDRQYAERIKKKEEEAFRHG